MAKYIYPAVFTPEKKGYSICFPDLEGCYTQGKNLEDGMDAANDVLCLTLYGLEEAGVHIPQASPMDDVSHKEDEFVRLVACDTAEYRDYFNKKT